MLEFSLGMIRWAYVNFRSFTTPLLRKNTHPESSLLRNAGQYNRLRPLYIAERYSELPMISHLTVESALAFVDSQGTTMFEDLCSFCSADASRIGLQHGYKTIRNVELQGWSCFIPHRRASEADAAVHQGNLRQAHRSRFGTTALPTLRSPSASWFAG